MWHLDILRYFSSHIQSTVAIEIKDKQPTVIFEINSAEFPRVYHKNFTVSRRQSVIDFT